MKKMTRILSAVLCIVMLLSSVAIGHTASEESPYKDVKVGTWSYESIIYATEKGYMSGVGNGLFDPKGTLTRAMVVSVLHRIEGAPEIEYTDRFTDVKKNKWYTDAVLWAEYEGIVSGTSDTTFAPDKKITRQEIATVLLNFARYRYVIEKEGADLSVYSDVSNVASWASEAVAWANAEGLIVGNKGKLDPKGNTTREMFASVLERFMKADFEYEIIYNAPNVKNKYTPKAYEKVEDADIYVATNGVDTNPGTIDKPLKTFEAAKAKVRELKATATDEIVVAFKKGDYGVLDNITFDAADSGTADVPIKYCAYGDGDVYFTNGVYIGSGDFTAISDAEKSLFTDNATSKIKKYDLSNNEYSDYISSSSVVFQNGKPATEARYPNRIGDTDMYLKGTFEHMAKEGSPFTIEELMAERAELVDDAVNADAWTDEYRIRAIGQMKKHFDTYDTFEGVKIMGYSSKIWNFDTLNVASYDNSYDDRGGIVNLSNKADYGFYNIDDVGDTKVYIAGSSKELDFAGEYWIDAKTKTLYVYDPQGEYLITTHDTFATIQSKVNYISFVGLNFRGSTDTALRVDGDNFTFDQGSIMYCGGEEAFVAVDVLDMTITNSEFAYFLGGGISIEGPDHNDRADFDYFALEGTGLLIENNSVHDVCITKMNVEYGCIDVDWQTGGKIAHNELYNSGRSGINFNWCIDLVIEYNYVDNCMNNSEDGGAIYCGRRLAHRGNIIRYNIVSNSGYLGIYLDDGQAETNIYGNIFYRCSYGAIMTNGGGPDNSICDNVYISCIGITGRCEWWDVTRYANLDPNGEWEGWMIKRLPAEDTPNGKIWKAKFPELYDIMAIYKDPSCYKETALYQKTLDKKVNYCANNYTFGGEHSFTDEWMTYSQNINNNSYSFSENPIFTNPALGDYSIRDGVDYADNNFSKIGRY